MKRLAVLLAVALIAPGAVPARAADPDFITAAVTWAPPDEEAKTITATVRLTLTPACTPSQMAARRDSPLLRSWCTVTPEIASAIRQNIETIWSGQTYRCYRIIVNVDVAVDDVSDPHDSSRLIVRVDQSASNIRSSVSMLGPVGGAWNGAAYDDRTFPTNTPGELSTWGYPPQGADNANLYAHEAGHVLGLEDGYEDVPDPNQPGQTFNRRRLDAPDDLMAHQRNGTIDATTMAVLMGRSGVFRKRAPKCDYKIDTTRGWYHFTSLKCGGIEGDWRIRIDGVFNLGGGRLVLAGESTVRLADDRTQSPARFTGSWDADFRIRVVGVPDAKGGQDGHVTGTASFIGQRTLSLHGVDASGTFFAQTPAYALSGAARNPKKDFALPVRNGAYCTSP